MLIIRLQRIGKKKKPAYRLVISEKARDTQARALEILGHYNPVEKNKITELKEDRIKYWISKGAQTSETVNNILMNAGVITGKKSKSVAISKKRQGKINEKAEELKAKEDEKKAKEKEAKQAEAKKVEDVKEETKEEVKEVEVEKTEEKIAEKTEAPEEKKEEVKEEVKEEPKEEEKK